MFFFRTRWTAKSLGLFSHNSTEIEPASLSKPDDLRRPSTGYSFQALANWLKSAMLMRWLESPNNFRGENNFSENRSNRELTHIH